METTQTPNLPAEVSRDMESGVSRATALIISDRPALEEAGKFAVHLVNIRKNIIATFKKPKESAWTTHKDIVAAEKEHLDPVVAAEGIVKEKIGNYTTLQENLAKKKAEEDEEAERQRLLKIAEDDRKKEEAKKIEIAEGLADEGRTEEAEAVLNEPIEEGIDRHEIENVYVPPVKQEKVGGISYRETWDFEVVDFDKVPNKYKSLDNKKIGGVVRALKKEHGIPGVRAFSNKTVIAKGSK